MTLESKRPFSLSGAVPGGAALIALLAIAALVSPRPALGQDGCVTFDSSPVPIWLDCLTGHYHSEASVKVEKQWWPGCFGGMVEVAPPSFGPGNAVFHANLRTILSFDHRPSKVVIEFEDWGLDGTRERLAINGSALPAGDICSFSGRHGGFLVTASCGLGPHGWVGVLEIEDGPKIAQVSITGEELWIDNICYWL